jgi:type IV pilus assembly protein PilM
MVFLRNAVGIDLGTHAIKVVSLRVSEKGVVVLQALRLERRVLEAEGLEPESPESLARHLKAHLSRARIPAKGVVLGIGGQESIVRYTRTPPVPAWRLKVIMDYELKEFSERIGEALASDYRLLPLAREPDEDQTILIAHAKEAPLAALLDAFEAEGITVSKAVPGAIALYTLEEALGRAAEPDAPEDDLALLADLGAENLNVALLLNGRLVFARSVKFGGRNFTESLAQALDLEPAEAEGIKLRRASLEEGAKGAVPEAVAPLRSTGGQLLGTLQSSLRFASSQTGAKLPSLSRLVLLGGGMRLRGLAPFLRQGLGVSSEFFQPTALQLSATVAEGEAELLKERPGEFGAALGLGLSALRDGKADDAVGTISILPARYVKRREFRERTLFLYAAGALLAFLLVTRLAYGVVLNLKAGSVHDGLEEQHSELSAARTQMEENRLRADEGRARLNRLLKEAEQTAFQAFVLDLLGNELRPEMQLTSVRWDLIEPESDDQEAAYVLKVSGKVNNEKRRGLEWILDLQGVMQSEERILRVEEESSKPAGAWYEFEFWLYPNYIRY